MSVVWSLSDAQAQFSALIAAAQTGQPQIVTHLNKNAVVVLSYAEYQRLNQSQANQQTPASRVPGLHQGQIWMSEDFNEPLPDEFWLGEEDDESDR